MPSTSDIIVHSSLNKAQPSTRSTGPRSPLRLGRRSQDLGLPDEYSLDHRGLSAASRRKLCFTSKHYTLLTACNWHYSTLQNSFFFLFCFLSQSKLIFKVPTTTWRVLPSHILINLIINWLLDANASRKWLHVWQRQRILSAWIPGLLTLKIQGSMPP